MTATPLYNCEKDIICIIMLLHKLNAYEATTKFTLCQFQKDYYHKIFKNRLSYMFIKDDVNFPTREDHKCEFFMSQEYYELYKSGM